MGRAQQWSDLTPRAGDWAARFSIQQMKPDHYAGKGYVHYQAWRESYRGLMGDQVLDGQTLEHCREMAAAYPENTLVLLDQNRSDQVAGFACYAPGGPQLCIPAGSLGDRGPVSAACIQGLGWAAA